MRNVPGLELTSRAASEADRDTDGHRRLSAAWRIRVIVIAIAIAAATTTVGGTFLQSRGETTAVATAHRQSGRPPLEFNFGIRIDVETRALTRAAALYNKGNVASAAAIFRRYHSLSAEIGLAFTRWPDLAAVDRIAAAHPMSALTLLHLGLVYDWVGRSANARSEWRRAESVEPNTPYALAAASLLHPEMPALPLPQFVPESPLPSAAKKRTFVAEFAALARLGRQGSIAALIYHGVAEQELGHQLSAERDFVRAARLAPNDPEALTAAAVGRFSKDDPSQAFSRLGPLAKRFPDSSVVRFHLGYLLIWLRQTKLARTELELARHDGPRSPYAGPATTLLKSLAVAARRSASG